MDNAEHELLELQFKNLGKLFDEKLKGVESTICGKVDGLESKFEETKSVVNNHVEWHNGLNRKIAGWTVKGGISLFLVIAVIAMILGVKGGVLASLPFF
jgi:hypothetical protein